MADERSKIDALKPFIGEWSMEMLLPGQEAGEDIGARVTFEWMPGETWLIESWTVPIEEAPDGIAIIGHNEARGALAQHYFDSRGVARIYDMSFEDGVWKLERTKDDYTPVEFAQRYIGTFTGDGRRIDGTWEIAHDKTTWVKDFDLNYIRVE